MDFIQELKHIEAKLGHPPRTFGLIEKWFRLRLEKPLWDWKGDDISIIFENWRQVFTHGQLAWGHITQVNRLMFEKDDDNCPGELVIDTVPDEHTLERLANVARDLYALKGRSAELQDQECKRYAEHLENERDRAFGLKVPRAVSENDNLFSSLVYFQRRHLPNWIVENSFFPVLYLEEDPKVVVIVPYEYWSKAFSEWWQGK